MSRDEAIARFRPQTPNGRFVDEAAATIGFLVGPDASGINDVCVPITT